MENLNLFAKLSYYGNLTTAYILSQIPFNPFQINLAISKDTPNFDIPAAISPSCFIQNKNTTLYNQINSSNEPTTLNIQQSFSDRYLKLQTLQNAEAQSFDDEQFR